MPNEYNPKIRFMRVYPEGRLDLSRASSAWGPFGSERFRDLNEFSTCVSSEYRVTLGVNLLGSEDEKNVPGRLQREAQ